MVESAYALAEGADALVLTTPWNEFKQLDMKRIRDLMNEPIIVDGKNIYDPDKMLGMGFKYRSVGRGYNGVGINNPDDTTPKTHINGNGKHEPTHA